MLAVINRAARPSVAQNGYADNPPPNYVDPTGLLQAGNPLTNLNPFAGGYSGGTVADNKFVNPYVASGGNKLNLGTLGTATANAIINAASSYVSPSTRAALSAGVSLAAASNTLAPPLLFTGLPIFDAFAKTTIDNRARREQEYQVGLQNNVRHDAALTGLYGPKAFKQAELREYNQILMTPQYGVSLEGISIGMTRLEDDVLLHSTGYRRTEAAVDLAKFGIRLSGQDIVRSDQWFAAQSGIRHFESAVGFASNPLTYAGPVAALTRFRMLALIDDAVPSDLGRATSRTSSQLPILNNDVFYPNFQRLPQDIAVNPVPPKASGPVGSIGLSQQQARALQVDLATARRMGATDIRVNQQQVNAYGARVGTNRPDLQFTLGDRQRVIVEYDTPDSPRALTHLYRNQANDPVGKIILKTIP
jgi:hypothetical protein